MGLIARQSFKAATFTYLGILMGVINNILIYPYVFKLNEYGEIQFVLQTASFFTPFLLVGFTSVIIKFYAEYNSTKSQRALYGMMFLVVMLSTGFFVILGYVFQQDIYDYYHKNSNTVSKHSLQILFAIASILPFLALFRALAAIHKRIAIPSFLEQLIKFILPALGGVYYFEILGFEDLLLCLFFYYLVLLIFFYLYVRNRDRLNFTFSLTEFRLNLKLKRIWSFALFSVFTGIGGTMVNQIDVVMITGILGTYQNGLYAWSLFIANAVAIPYGLISRISTPIISEDWSNWNLKKINELYTSSSSTLLVLSMCLFFSFWVVVDDLFALMPKGNEFQSAKGIVFLLCIAKIIDVGAGLNSQILSMSKSYKYLLWFLLVTAAVNVGLNFLFIPLYGLEGSGYATLISVIIFNLLKYFFLKYKYHMDPFVMKTLIIPSIAFFTYLVLSVLPRLELHLINLFLFSGLFCLIFLISCYRFNLAPELNNFANKQLIRIGIKPFDKK